MTQPKMAPQPAAAKEAYTPSLFADSFLGLATPMIAPEIMVTERSNWRCPIAIADASALEADKLARKKPAKNQPQPKFSGKVCQLYGG